MNRVFPSLNLLQQNFIDVIFVQKRTYHEAEQILKISKSEIQHLYNELRPQWQPFNKVRQKWKSKSIDCNFWDFCHWYLTAEKQCHYCGVTQEQLNQLHEIGLTNKRTKRGRTLEIDRKSPDENYSNLSNLTYSCYWCNNAKTDTFTEDEFKLIGKAIGQVWQQRLGI